jgi:FkbM family methyltransferase
MADDALTRRHGSGPITCFTYQPWWSAHPDAESICLEGYDAADKITYVIRTQKTFWELDLLEYIAMVGPVGGTYLDVGSNIGNHAVFFGRFCADYVVAIEPHPKLHPILTRNLDANGLDSRSTVVPVGISDAGQAGTMALRDEHEHNIGASHVVAGRHVTGGANVVLRPLHDVIDELTPSLPPVPITFLKIDVEGMEMGVLRSAARVLDVHRPQVVVELFTDGALKEASALLGEFGYQWVARVSNPPSYHFIDASRHSLRENKWHGGSFYSHRIHLAQEDLSALLPADAVTVVAAQDEVDVESLIANRRGLPFTERDGAYFGPPRTTITPLANWCGCVRRARPTSF